jgi:hypothetical protein
MEAASYTRDEKDMQGHHEARITVRYDTDE